MLGTIEKAIMAANIGLTPVNNGEVIRINIPPLTEERRHQLVKQVRNEGETAKISIRNARKWANDELKQLLKDGLPEDLEKEAIEKAAQGILDARAQYLDSSLADLYDPNTMPPVLVKAHQALDKAVDLCYRSQPFPNETKRIEFLFELYDKYTAGLFVKEKKTKKKAT